MSLFRHIFLKARISYEPFLFYTVGEDESDRSFIYPTVKLEPESELELGRKLPPSGLFELTELEIQGSTVGYLFKSSFTVNNFGGWLMAYLKTKGEATEHELLLRLNTLVIYNYPNRGTIAISPTVNESVAKVLEHQ